MAGILIIAHTPLATALQDCVTHIYGNLPARISALNVASNSDPVELIQTARAEVRSLVKKNGVLVLTDLFGATPSNIATQLVTLPQVRVIAGVNLSMLVRAISYRSMPLNMLVCKALAGGKQGIQLIDSTTTLSAAYLLPSALRSEHYATTRNRHH